MRWLAKLTRWLIGRPENQPHKNDAVNVAQVAEATNVYRDQAKQTAIDVGASLTVLGLLGQQLTNVAADVEQSVVGVCQGFQSMTQRAQSAIAAASETLEVTGAGTEQGLVGNVQSILESLLANVRSSSQYAVDLSSRLDALDARLRTVENSLDEVEEISAKARIVALNGQIEAARLGTAGMAFGVVAQETKVLADNAAKTSDTIRTLVSTLGKSLKQASSDLRTRTISDSAMVAQSESDVRQTLNELMNTHHRMTHSLQNSSQVGQALRGDIAKAVTAMQFQDRVKQRVSHVVETLQMLIQELHPITSSVEDEQIKARSQSWFARLENHYTMDAERQVHVGQNSSASSPVECSVELF